MPYLINEQEPEQTPRDTQFLEAATAMWDEQLLAIGFTAQGMMRPLREDFHGHMRKLIAHRLYDFAEHVLDHRPAGMEGQELQRIPDMPESEQ